MQTTAAIDNHLQIENDRNLYLDIFWWGILAGTMVSFLGIYLARSRDVTSAMLVINEISKYLDGRNVLPTKGLDAVINIFMELYPDEDEPIHPFLNDQIRSDLSKVSVDVDNFAIDIGLNSFSDVVKLLKDAEERTSYVATIEELQEKGVLFFD